MSLLSDSDELSTQCLQTLQFAVVVWSQMQSVEILRKCINLKDIMKSQSSGMSFILRQQVTETDGVAWPALVWHENNGASKRNVLVQAPFHLATCL